MHMFTAKLSIKELVWIHILVYSICLCQARKNVLFLVVDDLRPELGAYVSKTYPPYKTTTMHTPNIDGLASRSLLIERAYVQQALCGPSRASFLTSRRPDTTGVYKCSQYFRKTGGNFTTIPQYFKENGYTSVGMGKVFHFLHNPGGDDPISWSEPYFHGDPNFEDRHLSWEPIPDHILSDKPLLDEQTTNHALKTLRRLAPDATSGKQPFFMAVGFRRPHLPFVFPKSYLKFYPSVAVPDNPSAAVNMPELGWYSFKRIRSYKDTKIYETSGKINATTFPDETVINLRRAYYSCITWVDELIGRVLSELENLKLANNTIVSLVADHGYSLGENGLWSKQTNLELATHVPMMISIPGATDRGIKTKQLSELVDLFPTLAEAAGLKHLPVCPNDSSGIQECSEGTSLLPLIKTPDKPIKHAAFSQYLRDKFMGYSIRTDRYRYTEWIQLPNPSIPVYKKWKRLKAVELYDHETDPEENVNRAHDPEYISVRENLSIHLHDGWRKATIARNSNMYAKTSNTESALSVESTGAKTSNVASATTKAVNVKNKIKKTSSDKRTTSKTMNVESTVAESSTIASTAAKTVHMKNKIAKIPKDKRTTSKTVTLNDDSTVTKTSNVTSTIEMISNIESTSAKLVNVKNKIAKITNDKRITSKTVTINVENTVAKTSNVTSTNTANTSNIKGKTAKKSNVRSTNSVIGKLSTLGNSKIYDMDNLLSVIVFVITLVTVYLISKVWKRFIMRPAMFNCNISCVKRLCKTKVDKS